MHTSGRCGEADPRVSAKRLVTSCSQAGSPPPASASRPCLGVARDVPGPHPSPWRAGLLMPMTSTLTTRPGRVSSAKGQMPNLSGHRSHGHGNSSVLPSWREQCHTPVGASAVFTDVSRQPGPAQGPWIPPARNEGPRLSMRQCLDFRCGNSGHQSHPTRSVLTMKRNFDIANILGGKENG